MLNDALMLFPSGLADCSRKITGIEWKMKVEAAKRPARLEPITIVLCFFCIIVNNLEIVGAVIETSLYQKKDASTIKTKREKSIRILLCDINLLFSAG
jgi:hypothetical protein